MDADADENAEPSSPVAQATTAIAPPPSTSDAPEGTPPGRASAMDEGSAGRDTPAETPAEGESPAAACLGERLLQTKRAEFAA